MISRTLTWTAAVLAVGFAASAAPVRAADEPQTFTVNITDHKFDPAEVEVPANVKFKLTVRNNDGTPEEFESHELKREKIIPAKGEITVNIGPLKPGTYAFVGEYHEDTAKGKFIAK